MVQVSPPVDVTYGELIATALRRYPKRVAFIDDRDVAVTYAQAYKLFLRLRTALGLAGVGADCGVGILGSNTPALWLAQWAGVANGGRCTPLHPAGSFDDHTFVLADAELRVVIVDPISHYERGRQLAETAASGLIILTLGPADFGTDLLAAAAQTELCSEPVVERTLDDTCMVIYTGGTTARPKGIVHTHRAIVANLYLQLAEWGLPRPPNYLAITPISHAAGWFVLPALWLGGTVIMRTAFDEDTFFDTVESHRISMTFAVPSILYRLLQHPRSATADMSSIRMFFYGGAPADVSLLRTGLGLWGQIFVQLYGQSEAPNIVCTLLADDHELDRPDRLASCGRPSLAMNVRVLMSDGSETPDGEVGELCISGPLVMKEYWNRPDETAAALRDGWLYSGDLATRDVGGYLTIVGRAKDLIITGGYNVYPAEVESVLLEHRDVIGATVVGLPHPMWGEAVAAFVVLREGSEVDTDELLTLVRNRKGPVQTPKLLVVVDEIPLTSLGKADRVALRAEYAGHAIA